MKIVILLNFILLILFFSCSPQNSPEHQIPKESEFHPVEKSIDLLRGAEKKIYVSIYSSIPYNNNNRHIPLTAILSIRNTSTSRSIIISKVEYFDTNGKMLKSFLPQAISLKKMATKEFIIPEHDLSGGSGANFLVYLNYEDKTSKPVIESIMYGSVGNHSYSFVSRGEEIFE